MSENSAIAARFVPVRYKAARFLAPLTIFLGALLLFAVEPLIAKMILPWFGGSAEVWIACLLFFQAALLAGYLYAHLLTTRIGAAWQWRAHLFLLSVSLVFLPIIPAERWKPIGDEAPLPFILALLAATIGLPFLLLSATGPLLQAWLSRVSSQANAGRHVYRLYALSNLGSLIALLSYPVLIEPWLPTRVQAWSWSLLYCVFVLVSGAAAWRYRHAIAAAVGTDAEPRSKLTERLIWFLLAMAPSALLLAVTNHMLRNIAAIPLLWVVPLSLYLLSFIICFDNPRWYYRPLWFFFFAAAMGGMLNSISSDFLFMNYPAQLALYSAGFFVCCMVCHGELAALKPAPRDLTSYYLIIASGGAAGGLSVAAIAPAIFNGDYDLPILLPLIGVLVNLLAWRRLPASIRRWVRWNILIFVLFAWTALAVFMALRLYENGSLLSLRNFYGPLQVTLGPMTATTGEIIQLRNGNIIHGREFTATDRRCEPISYYAPESGIGVTLQEMGDSGPLKIGIIGLGAGTIAGYGRKGDTFRFYEINPLVRDLATKTFHYLSCPASSSVTMGDARLSLEREAAQNFDVLAVDAFSSDAIPVHLLTLEAFQLYYRHLKPNGILAVHVSNRYIDLAPIVALAAAQSGKTARTLVNTTDGGKGIDAASWVLVTSRPDFFARPLLKDAVPTAVSSGLRPWTDDYSNLWQALK